MNNDHSVSGALKRNLGDKFDSFKSFHKMRSTSNRQVTDLSVAQILLGDYIDLDWQPNDVINDLNRDFFWNVYSARPNLKEETPFAREINRKLVNKVTGNPAWKRSVLQFAGNKISSGVAAKQIITQLMNDKEIRDALKKAGSGDKDDEEADKLEKQAMMGMGSGDGEGEGEEGDGSGQGQSSQNFKQKTPAQQKQAEEAAKKKQEKANKLRAQADQKRQDANAMLDKALGSDGLESQMKMNAVIKDAAQKGGQVRSFLNSWGIGEGAGDTMTPDELESILAMLENNNMLGSLANMIGRTTGVAQQVLMGRSPVEILVDEGGVTQNIFDMFPDQVARLTDLVPNPIREQAFTEMAKDGGLAGMTRTSQAVREGIKVFAKDTSGSMADRITSTEDGKITTSTRLQVATGLILGLMRAARIAGQRSFAFSFSSNSEITETVTTDSALTKLFDWAAFSFSGGTDFTNPLHRCIDIIESMPEDDRRQADITIATDGGGSLENEAVNRYIKLRQRYGTRLYVLQVGSRGGGAFRKMADYIFEFESLEQSADVLSKLMWGSYVENENMSKEFKIMGG